MSKTGQLPLGGPQAALTQGGERKGCGVCREHVAREDAGEKPRQRVRATARPRGAPCIPARAHPARQEAFICARGVPSRPQHLPHGHAGVKLQRFLGTNHSNYTQAGLCSRDTSTGQNDASVCKQLNPFFSENDPETRAQGRDRHGEDTAGTRAPPALGRGSVSRGHQGLCLDRQAPGESSRHGQAPGWGQLHGGDWGLRVGNQVRTSRNRLGRRCGGYAAHRPDHATLQGPEGPGAVGGRGWRVLEPSPEGRGLCHARHRALTPSCAPAAASVGRAMCTALGPPPTHRPRPGVHTGQKMEAQTLHRDRRN